MALAVSTLSPSARKRTLNRRERRETQRALSLQLESYRLTQGIISPDDEVPETSEVTEDPQMWLDFTSKDGRFTTESELYFGRTEGNPFYSEEDEYPYEDDDYFYDEADYYDGFYPYYDPSGERQGSRLFAS